jgi:PAS domain-containing protein
MSLLHLPQHYLENYPILKVLPSRNAILLHEVAELGRKLVERRTKELQESKNFLESLIDSSPNVVISTDLSDRIIIFNKTAEKTFGYVEEDVIKRKIDFLFKAMPFRGKGKGRHSPISPEILCVKKDQTPHILSDLRHQKYQWQIRCKIVFVE